jgi:hypothetical protein
VGDAGEAVLSDLTLEEFVELSGEHAVAYELALLGEDTDHGLNLNAKKERRLMLGTAA